MMQQDIRLAAAVVGDILHNRTVVVAVVVAAVEPEVACIENILG